jgi:cytochrome c oxidase subunit 2
VNGTATLIAIAYGVVTVLGTIVAIVIAASTRGRRPLDVRKAAEGEKAWLFVMIAMLGALLFATIWFVPYGSSDAGGRVVHVSAQQFAWQIDPPSFPAHQKIAFLLTSKDVNHGFGIYDARDHFVVQVQVVPHKTQKLVHTFDRPGTYRILCLEFCGVGHHVMQASFEVTP